MGPSDGVCRWVLALTLADRAAIGVRTSMDVSNEQVRHALLSVVAFVLSVSFHEFGHAFVADKLGGRAATRARSRDAVAAATHRPVRDHPGAADGDIRLRGFRSSPGVNRCRPTPRP